MPRILHIEDDPSNRLLVRKLLAADGMEVIDAADGLEGIRKACECAPDLVLVDINIPQLDGYEVTLRLRGEPSLVGTPIVAITAEGDRETSLAVGCDGYFQKPIDARTFARAVRGYLKGHRESAAPGPDDSRLRQQSQRIVAHLEEKVAELSAANHRLVELDRARTSFYRNVSHELATPMTPIVGYVKLLADGELGPLSAGQARALRSVDDCVARLRAVIDNLLDVTGLETGKLRLALRSYDLAEVLRQVVEAARGRGLHVSLDLPEPTLPGVADPERVSRAVAQLLDNAGKFAGDAAQVAVVAARAGAGYRVSVGDDGPGVPAGRDEAIFEPFYQVDASPTRQHGGVGVGLAIVRRVARGHGGDARLVREPLVFGGGALSGAVFEVTLPVDAGRA
ncbi:MAG: hybrid sensor histidine kinase/response regulator [Polyangiaceae bacterium]|nr:hybrid sensor histidine kinase/response regulator [Polyangiaceae bacterium]